MSSSQEGPNPLRPYYVPPSVGLPPDIPPHGGATPSFVGKNASTSTTNFSSSARNILSDIDYSDYLATDSASSPDVIKRLIEQAIWKYLSVFLAQPFDVAKTILQVHVARVSQKGSPKDLSSDDSRRRYDIYEVFVSSIYMVLTAKTGFRTYPKTTLTTHPPTSPPMLPLLIPQLDIPDLDVEDINLPVQMVCLEYIRHSLRPANHDPRMTST